MIFMRDQNKQVSNLLKLDIEYEIVILSGMKYKFTDLNANSTYQFRKQIVYIFRKENLPQ